MRPNKYGPYLAAGLTAFSVVAAAIVLFFFLEHFSVLWELMNTVGYILRPIFYGMVLAFLLLPVHRRIFALLMDRFRETRDPWGRKRGILNGLSILLSLFLAFLLLYILLGH